MKRVLVIAVGVILAAQAAAQPRRQSQPTTRSWWAGAAIGLLPSFSVADGSTNSQWQFGSVTPLRLSLEKSMGGTTTLGLAVIGERVPLTYRGPFTSGCANCSAHATLRQALVILHSGAGADFFGLGRSFAIGVGATGFSSFKADDAGPAAIGPSCIDWDPTIFFGYGFALPLGERFELQLTPELQTLIHQRTGLTGGEDSFTRVYMITIGARYRLW